MFEGVDAGVDATAQEIVGEQAEPAGSGRWREAGARPPVSGRVRESSPHATGRTDRAAGGERRGADGTGTRRRIFISYRREETAYPAGWLFDRLKEHFGEGSVFKDLDSIEFGEDFSAAIADAVGSCDVLLALIGQRWDTLTDERGHRRISKPDDWVRREIEAALARNVRVIPILVDRARMPHAAELPPSLAPLVKRQALEISPSRFTVDTTRLIAALEKTLDENPVPSRGGRSGSPDPTPPDVGRRRRGCGSGRGGGPRHRGAEFGRAGNRCVGGTARNCRSIACNVGSAVPGADGSTSGVASLASSPPTTSPRKQTVGPSPRRPRQTAAWRLARTG